jgi:ribose transport system substrate-binding protein
LEVKRMKTVLLCALATAMLVAAAGCGDDDDGSNGGASGESGGKHEVTLINGWRSDPFYLAIGCGAKEVAERAGADLTIEGPEKFDASLQIPVVNAVAATMPDGVAAVAADPVALYRPMKELVDNGAKLVLYDGTLENDEIAESVVLSSNEKGGQAAAQEMARLTGKQGKVLVLSDKPGNIIQQARVDSFREELERLAPNMEIVGVEYAQGDTARASQAVSGTLAREPDLAGVYSTGGVEREGATAALREAGKFEDVANVGYGEGPEVERVRSGQVDALISQNPFEEGRVAMQQLIDILDGKKVKRYINLDVTVVRQDNLDSPEVQSVINGPTC